MSQPNQPLDELIHELKERAKELTCLYQVQELLSQPGKSLEEICAGLVDVLPSGWQYPDICQVQISIYGITCQTQNFVVTSWKQEADIIIQDEKVGYICVYYVEERGIADEGPFLKEERKLINTIAEQVGFSILHQQLRHVFTEQLRPSVEQKNAWQVILDLLKRTDPGLLLRLTRKMINFLIWNDVGDVQRLVNQLAPVRIGEGKILNGNEPYPSTVTSNLLSLTDEVFTIAHSNLEGTVILDCMQKWIKEDRSSFMVNVLINPGSSLAEIASACERYHVLATQGIELTPPREKWFRVALIRRILGDHPVFLDIAKKHISIDDFSEFLRRVIYPLDSHGKLGGKSSGLFLAEQVIKRSTHEGELLRSIKTPKTWYLTSDSLFHFMSYNNLEDIIEQKYKEVGQIRQEYPYIVNIFKNSPLPPEIIKGLSQALDDFRDIPLIVRSSSLLEDQSGLSFAGKYKSLFIANQGTKEERLLALMDAVKEVFASIFAPDPMEYRQEHGLLDYHEEMGILIQEVVGVTVGQYYLPAFAGVAFSKNEYRWSSRIRREDGLVRIVPGLGTRAVDRMSDDYPILIAPGQPGLRVNVTQEEITCYSPRKIDVINLSTRAFETIMISDLLDQHGHEYPLINQVVSVRAGDYIYPYRHRARIENSEKAQYLVTFEGLFSRTSFLNQVRTVLNVLQEAFGRAVDIEFAHDGIDLYLLQCRLQSYRGESIPAEIPRNIPLDSILFSAKRHIPNGSVSGITHIVYVSPQRYYELSNHQDLFTVGRVIGRLNQVLPRRQFVLMGPGRWGSRGDIKLGVSVTYADICNTAMLVEVAQRQRDFIPDPSFGTHFFQDLVEANIQYLPLYPDDAGIIYNEQFFEEHNSLTAFFPEYASLAGVVHVIDIPAVTQGKVLQVLMNADQEMAVAVLSSPNKGLDETADQYPGTHRRAKP